MEQEINLSDTHEQTPAPGKTTNLHVFNKMVINRIHFPVIEVNETPQPEKLRRGRTRCIRLSRNGVNEKEELKFNAQGRVCSKNASTFASWCGCIVRKRTNAPLMVKDWKDIPKEPIDYEQKMLQLVSVSFFVLTSTTLMDVCCLVIIYILLSPHVYCICVHALF